MTKSLFKANYTYYTKHLIPDTRTKSVHIQRIYFKDATNSLMKERHCATPIDKYILPKGYKIVSYFNKSEIKNKKNSLLNSLNQFQSD